MPAAAAAAAVALNSTVDVPFNEPLVTLLVHGTAVNVLTLVGFTALIYDHFVTLSDEVHLIWRARKGVVSTIFLLNRYIVPVMLALDIFETFGNVAVLLTFCKVWTIVQSYLTIASYISIHAIVAWRVYAIYNGQAWISRLLWVGGFLNFAISAGITTASLIPIISNLRPYHHACVGTVPDYIWSIWLPSVVFETLLFGLTITAMYHHGRRHSLTSLSLLLYRDGMLYFIAVTFCSLFSLMVWALAGPDLLGLARYFALAMVNIAGARLVLNLKAYAAARQGGDSDLAWDVPLPLPSTRTRPSTAPFPSSSFLSSLRSPLTPASPAPHVPDAPYFTPAPPKRARRPAMFTAGRAAAAAGMEMRYAPVHGLGLRYGSGYGYGHGHNIGRVSSRESEVDDEEAFDFEMYAIERECQQLGTRIR